MALPQRNRSSRPSGPRLAGLVALVLVGTVLAACETFIQTVEPTPTLITRTESVRQRPMVPVTQGLLIEAIRTTARVEALNRTELAFKTDGRVKTMYVTQGDSVKQGDILAELETGRLESDIESSQEALQNAELRLDAARTRARDERASAQRAVAAAELTLEELRTSFSKLLRRATAEQLEALKIDVSTRDDRGDVDLRVTEAEAALVRAQRTVTNAEGRLAEVKAEAAGVISEAQARAQAQASLDGLKADLIVATESLRALESGRGTTGASPAETARAQVDAAVAAVAAATAALVRAEQDVVNAQDVLDGADDAVRAQVLEDVHKARSAIVDKKAEVARLAETLHEVTFRPFPHEVEAAEQDLEKARLTRDEINSQSSRATSEAKQRAELDYQAALRAYNEAIRPATPVEIETVRANYEIEVAALALLEADLADLLNGGSEAIVVEQLIQKTRAELEVQLASAVARRDESRHRLREAEFALQALIGGGSTAAAIERIAEAIRIEQSTSLTSARARVQAASARIDQYLRGQTEAEALARHTEEVRITSLTALPDAEAALEAALADLRVAEVRFHEATGTPSLAQLRVALNNEQAAILDFDATVENFERFERGESATDFELQILENEVERSRIALEALLTQSEDNVIRAPFDGEITFTRGRAGSQARAFNEVIGIADPSDLIIEVRIPEQDQSKMSIGQASEVALDAFPGVKFQGTVSAIPRTIVTQTGQTVRIPDALVEVDFEGNEVRMGMLARVNITLQVKEDVLKVPVTALRDLNERTFVETVVNEQRRSLPVVTGIRSDSEVEVLSGLEEGQMIFAAP
jgi:multidrug efflux pump subunit AcrA (membrane-fusion protein)